MRKFASLSALGLSLALLARSTPAEPPHELNPGIASPSGSGLNNLVQSSSEPDINAGYAVTAEAGLWMICAASYQGPDAPELANKLCSYLREHRYPAHVYNRGNEERKQLQEE